MPLTRGTSTECTAMGGNSGHMSATEEMAGDRQSAYAPTVAPPHESLETATPPSWAREQRQRVPTGTRRQQRAHTRLLRSWADQRLCTAGGRQTRSQPPGIRWRHHQCHRASGGVTLAASGGAPGPIRRPPLRSGVALAEAHPDHAALVHDRQASSGGGPKSGPHAPQACEPLPP